MKKGFSLVELLVVSTIIALLATVGLVSYGTLSKQSRDSRRKADLQNIRSALEFYRADNDYYPNALTSLVPSQYIKSVPDDPQSGRNYKYCPTGVPSATDYALCASLEQGSDSVTCCGANPCGSRVSCNYKLTPLGED